MIHELMIERWRESLTLKRFIIIGCGSKFVITNTDFEEPDNAQWDRSKSIHSPQLKQQIYTLSASSSGI